MAGWASDWYRSKTTWLGLAAIVTAAATAYADKLDWRAALAAAFFAGFKILERDTAAKAAERTVAAVHTNTAAVQTVAKLQAVDTVASVVTADAAQKGS